MRRTRVIPVLLLSNGGVYKTTKFKKPIYIGDPINAIRLFNDLEVDEIVVLDIAASKQGVAPNIEMIKEISSEAFMPFAYGGGIKTVEDARRVLQCGIEKIVINRAIQDSAQLITDCAKIFGSQSIIASIDYKNKLFSGNVYFDHVSGNTLSKELHHVAISAERAGAGELLINSVDRDGVMSGLDVDVIRDLSSVVRIPIIASGGCGNLDHLQEAEKAGASAIAAGSMFVFHGKQRGVLINYPKEKDLRKVLT